MSDDNIQSYLFKESSEVAESEPLEEEPSYLEGICPKCLDTGFKHTIQDGILGIAYRVEGENSIGQPIKRPLLCDCKVSTTF